eukprot:GGOE01055516.1.p1 GENE.GGOE01055516.1~~GGOE01055516.1.p1  ORF type:complete len:762 (+),score=125.36 GGOE01055516.1:809-3094(+)
MRCQSTPQSGQPPCPFLVLLLPQPPLCPVVSTSSGFMLRAPMLVTAGTPIGTRVLHQHAGGAHYYTDPAPMRVYQPLDACYREDGGESASAGLRPRSFSAGRSIVLSSSTDPREPRTPYRSNSALQAADGLHQSSRRSHSLDSRLGAPERPPPGLVPREPRRTAELMLGSPVRGRSISAANGRDPLQAPSFLATEQGRLLYTQDKKEAADGLCTDIERRLAHPVSLALDYGLSGQATKSRRVIAYSESIAPYSGGYEGPYVLGRPAAVPADWTTQDTSDGEEGGEWPSSQRIGNSSSGKGEAPRVDLPTAANAPTEAKLVAPPAPPHPFPNAQPAESYDARPMPVPQSQWRQRQEPLDIEAPAVPRTHRALTPPASSVARPPQRSRSAEPRRTTFAFDGEVVEDKPAVPVPLRGPSPVRGRAPTRTDDPRLTSARSAAPEAGSERGTESATASVGRRPSPAARRSRSHSTPSQLALAAEAEGMLTRSMARAVRQAELANLDLSSVQLSVAASSRLELARQQMEAALQKHDAEFDRAVKLSEMQKEQERFTQTQLVKLEMVTSQRSAERNALARARTEKAKQLMELQQLQRMQHDAERRRIRERHEQMVEEWREELLLREENEQNRMLQRKREQEEERLRRRIAAQERSEYIQQVNLRNQLMIQDKADRTYCDIVCRQHDKVKAGRMAQVKERARVTNQYKEIRHRLARELQDQEVESLRVRQCVKDWEQAQVDEEIERMRRIVKEDRRNLDRALEQLRREG